MYSLNDNVKEWYLNQYPYDVCGEKINDKIVFDDIYQTLDCEGDIYATIEIHDSIIRERLFEHLSDIIGVDYEVIYEQWLRGK